MPSRSILPSGELEEDVLERRTLDAQPGQRVTMGKLGEYARRVARSYGDGRLVIGHDITVGDRARSFDVQSPWRQADPDRRIESGIYGT